MYCIPTFPVFAGCPFDSPRSLGHWFIGLLGYWVIGLLGYWVSGSLGKREGRRDGRKSTCADKEQADKDKKLPVTTTKSNLYT